MTEGLPLATAEHRTLTIAGGTAVMTLEQDVPAGAQKLIWEEFFASRGRGIDWATHFPWAARGVALCASATVAASAARDGVVAALLIRRVPGTTSAMIGYVCVDPAFRGDGLSRQLIDLAALPLRRIGMERMLLWTGKPRVYEGSGFVVDVHEQRFTVRDRTAVRDAPVALSPWPAVDTAVPIGLPPFATAGWQVTTPETHIVFVDTPMGATLLGQSGPPSAVLRMMFAARSGDWSLTLDADHPLRYAAIAHGACIEEAPGPVAMHRPLGADTTPPAYVPPTFRI